MLAAVPSPLYVGALLKWNSSERTTGEAEESQAGRLHHRFGLGGVQVVGVPIDVRSQDLGVERTHNLGRVDGESRKQTAIFKEFRLQQTLRGACQRREKAFLPTMTAS